MEDILRKREQKLIKEGLNFIDSFEEYTSKNNPDIYKKYLDLKEKRLIANSSKWSKHINVLENIKNEINKRNLSFLESYDDMFKEMEKYINTFKPKVFLERKDLHKIHGIVDIINEISKLPNQTRLNYDLKCHTFFYIKMLLNNYKHLLN